MTCNLLYENHPLPGDEVYVDFQSMGIPKIKNYDTVGMIVMENKPIHTFVYKVMLYSNDYKNNATKYTYIYTFFSIFFTILF